jgi:arsenic resistance protein ArsH
MDALPVTHDTLPALRRELLASSDIDRLEPAERAGHPPRILLLFGSLRALLLTSAD